MSSGVGTNIIASTRFDYHQQWKSVISPKKYARHGFATVIKTALTEQTKMSQGGFVETKKIREKSSIIDHW